MRRKKVTRRAQASRHRFTAQLDGGPHSHKLCTLRLADGILCRLLKSGVAQYQQQEARARIVLRQGDRELAMFFQLKMFESLTTRTVFKLTETDLAFAQRLRLLCSIEDWDNADAVSRIALRVAEKFVSGWIPEEVCQIYADIGLACRSTGKHAKAIDMSKRAICIAREFGYESLESSSSANLGYAYICAGKWEDAVGALEYAKTCMELQASVENGAEIGCELLENLADAHQVESRRVYSSFSCPFGVMLQN